MALQGAGFHNSKIDATTTDHQCYGQSYRAGRVGKYRRWFVGFENVVKSENAWFGGKQTFFVWFSEDKNCFVMISRHSHQNFTVPPRSSKYLPHYSTLLKNFETERFFLPFHLSRLPNHPDYHTRNSLSCFYHVYLASKLTGRNEYVIITGLTSMCVCYFFGRISQKRCVSLFFCGVAHASLVIHTRNTLCG